MSDFSVQPPPQPPSSDQYLPPTQPTAPVPDQSLISPVAPPGGVDPSVTQGIPPAGQSFTPVVPPGGIDPSVAQGMPPVWQNFTPAVPPAWEQNYTPVTQQNFTPAVPPGSDQQQQQNFTPAVPPGADQQQQNFTPATPPGADQQQNFTPATPPGADQQQQNFTPATPPGSDQQQSFTVMTGTGAQQSPGGDLAAFQRSLMDAGLRPWVEKQTPFEDSIAGNTAYSPVVDNKTGEVEGYTRAYTSSGVDHLEVIDRNGNVVANVTTGERGVTSDPISPADLLTVNPAGIVEAIGTGLAKIAGDELVATGAQAVGKAAAEDAVTTASRPTLEAGERVVGSALSYGERAEVATKATYFADAEGTAAKQKAVDLTRGASADWRVTQTADGTIRVQETRTGGEWIQSKVLDAAANPDTLPSRVENNIDTAMSKFIDLVDHPDAGRNVPRWSASDDGSMYRLQLSNPTKFTIHLEVPGLDPSKLSSLTDVAQQQLARWADHVPAGVEIRVQIHPHR